MRNRFVVHVVAHVVLVPGRRLLAGSGLIYSEGEGLTVLLRYFVGPYGTAFQDKAVLRLLLRYFVLKK